MGKAREECPGSKSGEQRNNDPEATEAQVSEPISAQITLMVLYLILHSQCCILLLQGDFKVSKC